MIARKNTVLGVEYNIQAPENIQEAIVICGGEDGGEALLLEHFIQKLVYNHHNADVRSSFVEKVEELTGIKRGVETKTTGKKNEDGTDKTIEVYTETETEYFNRVLSETGTEASEYASYLQEIADASPLDGKKKARTGGGPKLAKMYLTAAQTIVDKGSEEKAAGILGAELGYTVEPTLEGLAKALKDREDRKRKEFAAQLGLM